MKCGKKHSASRMTSKTQILNLSSDQLGLLIVDLNNLYLLFFIVFLDSTKLKTVFWRKNDVFQSYYDLFQVN